MEIEMAVNMTEQQLCELKFDLETLHKNFPGSSLDSFAQRNPEHQYLCGLVKYLRENLPQVLEAVA